MLTFHCACGKQITAPEQYEGGSVTCPRCGTAVVARLEAMSPAVPASPLGYAVPVEERGYAGPPRKHANGLGIAALVLGLVAMLFAWVPICGFVPALLFAVVGGILGVVGLIAALSDRRTGIGFPLAGIAVCIAAPLLNVLLFALLAWSGNRAQLAQARQAQAAAAAAAAQGGQGQMPGSGAANSPAAGDWVPADRHAVLGDLEVWVGRVAASVEAAAGTTPPGRHLVIDLRVRNNSATRTLNCRTWAGAGSAPERDIGTLADDLGNSYNRIAPHDGPRARAATAPLRPGATWSDVLRFEPPVQNASHLDLELPATNVGAEGFVRIRIPASMIENPEGRSN